MKRTHAVATIVNSQDKQRLEPHLAPSYGSTPVYRLRELLGSAKVVPPRRTPGDVVTMNSRVRLRDLQWETSETVTLVYPDAATEDDATAVSVTSPLGAALLGARVGQEVGWSGPRGPRRILVESLEFQPEQAGRFDL